MGGSDESERQDGMGEREGERRRAGGRESRVGGALGSLAKLKILQPTKKYSREEKSIQRLCVCACVRAVTFLEGVVFWLLRVDSSLGSRPRVFRPVSTLTTTPFKDHRGVQSGSGEG